MKQEYPGDIRPLLNACESLARDRRAALERVRTEVCDLKSDVVRALDQFTVERAESRRQVRNMTQGTVRRLHENRLQRSAQLQELREGFQQAARQRQATLRATLTAAREAVQARVEELRARTASAKLTRFRSGSFDQPQPGELAPPADGGVARRRRVVVRNNEVADFLDSLGPDGGNSRT